MTQSYPKRLIEVDLPIKRISAHARREKSIRHGHISTLHIWWARRPLAACRAVICASLWPDPADPLCPQSFRDRAAELIFLFATAAASNKELGGNCDRETWIKWQTMAKNGSLDSHNEAHLNLLRFALLDFIADFANWDNSTVPEYLETSRALTHAAHEALGGEPGTRPLVVDPFAGGGSIPLEALRVGADAFASDLNPIPVLLNKVLLEYIPKYGPRLADEVRKWGEWIKNEAARELAHLYPTRHVFPDELQNKPLLLIDVKPNGFGYVTVTDAQEHFDTQGGRCTHFVSITTGQAHGPTAMNAALGDAGRLGRDPERRLKELGAQPIKFVTETPIAYLWARTIQCEGPGCGAEVPLIRSQWLAKTPRRSVALHFIPNPKAKLVELMIITKQAGEWVNQDNRKQIINGPKFDGTVKRGSATCPCCGYTTPVANVREQLKHRHGGANDARLLCVVSTRVTESGRFYRLPTCADLRSAKVAGEELTKRPSVVPDVPISQNELRRISIPIYGMETWGDVYSSRQTLVLQTLARLAVVAGERADPGIKDAVTVLLALALGRQADACSSLARWHTTREINTGAFGRQALGMVWDFCEINPFSGSSGGWDGVIQWIAKVCESQGKFGDGVSGESRWASATSHPLPDEACSAWITDPPYYDAVPYAHLSDYFYVWLRRVLHETQPELFRSTTVVKEQEIVVDRAHSLSHSKKDVKFYERELTRAFAEGQRVLAARGIGLIVFASKSTASWEAILNAVVEAGWIISASWPIDTEMEARVSAQGQARLASSVHLVCRPKKNLSASHDDFGEWRDVLHELPRRIHEWMPRLASEGVVGADAIFACLGPALEIFSRYSRVEKANGDVVALKEYLEQVWAAVAKEALTQVFQGADATGFEPDARLTAMWLWTLAAPTADGQAAETEDEEDDDNDEETKKKPKLRGFKLEFDAARKIAQGLGAVLEQMPHLVEVKGEEARLLPVSERTGHLFGKDQEEPVQAGRKKAAAQMDMFAQLTDAEDAEIVWKEKTVQRVGETTLDRVHQAMILFAAGRGEALRRFVVDDGVGNDGKFWRLAQALAALYPTGSDERRWVEGVMARKRQFGF